MWIMYPREGAELNEQGVYDDGSLFSTDAADEFLVRMSSLSPKRYEVVATGMIGGEERTERTIYWAEDQEECYRIIRTIFNALDQCAETLDLTE